MLYIEHLTKTHLIRAFCQKSNIKEKVQLYRLLHGVPYKPHLVQPVAAGAKSTVKSDQTWRANANVTVAHSPARSLRLACRFVIAHHYVPNESFSFRSALALLSVYLGQRQRQGEKRLYKSMDAVCPPLFIATVRTTLVGNFA